MNILHLIYGLLLIPVIWFFVASLVAFWRYPTKGWRSLLMVSNMFIVQIITLALPSYLKHPHDIFN